MEIGNKAIKYSNKYFFPIDFFKYTLKEFTVLSLSNPCALSHKLPLTLKRLVNSEKSL